MEVLITGERIVRKKKEERIENRREAGKKGLW